MMMPLAPMARAHNREPLGSRRALVAFSGQTELVWLHVLRPGFRHCFAVVETESQSGTWMLYNPLSNGTQLALWPHANEKTIRAWLCQHGYCVIETHTQPISTRTYGWRPYTCVEAMKRVLGLHAPAVFTPWQLSPH